jgi:hypothetical protein
VQAPRGSKGVIRASVRRPRGVAGCPATTCSPRMAIPARGRGVEGYDAP